MCVCARARACVCDIGPGLPLMPNVQELLEQLIAETSGASSGGGGHALGGEVGKLGNGGSQSFCVLGENDPDLLDHLLRDFS